MPFLDYTQTPPPQVVIDEYVMPPSFVQGDRFLFRVKNQQPKASADGWSYILVVRIENPPGNQSGQQLNSSIDKWDFLIQADPGTTAGWVPGRYQWSLFAVNGGIGVLRETVSAGFLDVLPDLRTATGDVRSHARRTLDLIEALIEGRVSNDILESVIDNTRFTRMNPEQLLTAHSYYTAKVRSEEAKARAKQGLATGRLILTRFVTPQ